MTNNRLAPIILQKQREVAALKNMLQNQPAHEIKQILQGKKQRGSIKSLKKSLNCSSLAVIAEIKRRSPSKGSLALINDPRALAKSYVTGGASALSVLTDELFFGGKLDDLAHIAATLHHESLPILRKDFIIDEVQIAEAIAAGADAILCIVAILGKKTSMLINHAKEMGIEVLVEVHNQAELEIAFISGAEIIGVNNRNLSTFAVDTECAFNMIESIPHDIVSVAESGILAPEMARNYYHAGFNAVLIGEALVTSSAPIDFIRACRDG